MLATLHVKRPPPKKNLKKKKTHYNSSPALARERVPIRERGDVSVPTTSALTAQLETNTPTTSKENFLLTMIKMKFCPKWNHFSQAYGNDFQKERNFDFYIR